MSVEPAVLENIDIKASTPQIVDNGHINGYNYRVFKFIEGKSLSHRQEKGFEDLDREQEIERIRQIGKALAHIHESWSFEGFGTIQTLNNEIIRTSSSNWSEGLRDIQHFWHHHVGGQEFEEIKQEIEDYYSEKEEVLDKVDRSVLIHQEIGFHNLLFQEDSVTVIDWESAGAGDPLLDVITAEVILFWFQGLKEELREKFRQAYLSVREIKFDEGLIKIYRVVELSRLLMIFDDEDKVDRIKDKIESIV